MTAERSWIGSPPGPASSIGPAPATGSQTTVSATRSVRPDGTRDSCSDRSNRAKSRSRGLLFCVPAPHDCRRGDRRLTSGACRPQRAQNVTGRRSSRLPRGRSDARAVCRSDGRKLRPRSRVAVSSVVGPTAYAVTNSKSRTTATADLALSAVVTRLGRVKENAGGGSAAFTARSTGRSYVRNVRRSRTSPARPRDEMLSKTQAASGLARRMAASSVRASSELPHAMSSGALAIDKLRNRSRARNPWSPRLMNRTARPYKRSRRFLLRQRAATRQQS